ncbi:MAG: sensor histidine kinase [Hyphomicrobiales bacterium]
MWNFFASRPFIVRPYHTFTYGLRMTLNSALPFNFESSIAGKQLAAPPPFLDLLPVALYGCDIRGRILWFNGRAVDLWGRTPPVGGDSEQFCGSHELHREGRPVETPMAQVLRTGVTVLGAEGVVERPNGTRIWTTMHIDPVFDEDGRVAGAINCFHDTSELHEATAQLRRQNDALLAAQQELTASERKYRDILEALPAAIYTTDAKGTITYYNRAAVELSGQVPQLGADRWCVTHRLFRPDGTPLPHDQCPMAVTLKEDRAVRNVEAVAERPDGTRIPILPYPTPLHDASGALLGAVNMLVDISDRKAAESRQQHLMREINHRVKNNMQMLLSLLVTARREHSGNQARDALADACRRVAAMAGAQQVLYASTNGMSFSSREFVEAVCSNAQLAFPPNVSILCDIASGVLANDKAMPLALILSELLTNAVTHGNAAGGAPIRVGLTEELLFVEDSGPGFELKEARKQGSGLGLVQGLAAQLGARFEVERTAGARCVLRLAGAR